MHLTSTSNACGWLATRRHVPCFAFGWYVDSETGEQWINDFKAACAVDRLSNHRFWANQFRVSLHAAADLLLDTLRRWLLIRGKPRLQLESLRLLKIGGWVQWLTNPARLCPAQSHPGQPLWHLLAARRGRP